jgi:hypothetical protein
MPNGMVELQRTRLSRCYAIHLGQLALSRATALPLTDRGLSLCRVPPSLQTGGLFLGKSIEGLVVFGGGENQCPRVPRRDTSGRKRSDDFRRVLFNALEKALYSSALPGAHGVSFFNCCVPSSDTSTTILSPLAVIENTLLT